MLPFDNKNELLLVLDFDKGTTLERTRRGGARFRGVSGQRPGGVGLHSYVGLAAPMDFNGLVRHYYLRQGDDVAQMQLNLAGKKNRQQQSHAIGLRMRNELQAIADRHEAQHEAGRNASGSAGHCQRRGRSLRLARPSL